jgi:hypothetical protein
LTYKKQSHFTTCCVNMMVGSKVFWKFTLMVMCPKAFSQGIGLNLSCGVFQNIWKPQTHFLASCTRAKGECQTFQWDCSKSWTQGEINLHKPRKKWLAQIGIKMMHEWITSNTHSQAHHNLNWGGLTTLLLIVPYRWQYGLH